MTIESYSFAMAVVGSIVAWSCAAINMREWWRKRRRPFGTINLTPNQAPTICVTVTTGMNSFTGLGLIDTGCGHTVIDEASARRCGGLAGGIAHAKCFRGESTACSLYKARNDFPGGPRQGFRLTALAYRLMREDQSYVAIIGRDILQYSELSIKGDLATLTIQGAK